MFTGLVECTGTVRRLARSGGGAVLELEVSWPGGGFPATGDSVAVNGACLTVVDPGPQGFAAHLSPETLARTTLGRLRAGEAVNLERSLRLGDRLGGHLVLGHVDAVVRLLAVRREGGFVRWRVSLPPSLAPEVALLEAYSWSLFERDRCRGDDEPVLERLALLMDDLATGAATLDRALNDVVEYTT